MDTQVAGNLRHRRRISKGIEALHDPRIAKADGQREHRELGRGQRAGDACGPQVRVASRLVLELALNGDVGEIKPAAGAKHAMNLAEYLRFVRREIDDTVGQNDVDALVVNRQRFVDTFANV